MDTPTFARLYREYSTFFAKAERERRWNVYEDVPWDKVNREVTDELALVAETFLGVEMYLPDYVSGALSVVRGSFGQTWFQANWAYEESKHSLVLMEWLLRSGKRSEEQMADFTTRIFDKKWTLPFTTARQMTIYGCVQEMATFVIYVKQRERAGGEGCEALRTIFDLVARDEIAHTRFYQGIIKFLLEQDRDGTLDDFSYVLEKFEMPGVSLVPNYDDRIEVMRSAGIDRNVFLQKVYFPILKFLDLSRHDIVQATARRRAREQGLEAPETRRATA